MLDPAVHVPHNGFVKLVRSFLLESLPRYDTKRDFPLGNEKRRFVATLGNVKSICHASIACRRILIALLYWNEGMESGMQASAA